MPFCVKLTNGSMDDSFYFQKLPSKVRLTESLRQNQALADAEWFQDYNEIILAVRDYEEEFPTHWPSRLAHSGFPLSDKVSIGITQFKFVD
jgi:hypothetical protein